MNAINNKESAMIFQGDFLVNIIFFPLAPLGLSSNERGLDKVSDSTYKHMDTYTQVHAHIDT